MFFSCSSDFSAKRITRPGKFGRVIIAAKDGGSMLRTELWNQVLYLDQVCFFKKIFVKLISRKIIIFV